jgi:hypothetical protein
MVHPRLANSSLPPSTKRAVADAFSEGGILSDGSMKAARWGFSFLSPSALDEAAARRHAHDEIDDDPRKGLKSDVYRTSFAFPSCGRNDSKPSSSWRGSSAAELTRVSVGAML